MKEEIRPDLRTTTQAAYQPFTVEQSIMSRDRQAFNSVGKSRKRVVETVDPFVSSTTYKSSFADWEGGTGSPQKKKQIYNKTPAKFDDGTTYKSNFHGTQDQEGQLNDSMKRKELRDLMR